MVVAKLDYAGLLRQHDWIITRNQNCILSPDTDGLLCGLLVAHYLQWRIRGFYDGKVLIKERDTAATDCVFLDMEIFRSKVRSVGQHMLLFNKKHLPKNWRDLQNCISANNLRGYDFRHDFKTKYPFGTIHLLLAILTEVVKVEISPRMIALLLYADGTFKNLFNYPENCLSWLQFLGGNTRGNILHKVFYSDHYSISDLMIALQDIFNEFKLLNGGKRGGDKIKISDGKGRAVNLTPQGGVSRRQPTRR